MKSTLEKLESLNEAKVMNLDFGLALVGDSSQNEGNKYEQFTELSKFADENEFKTLWTFDHNSCKATGLFPNMAVVNSALIMLTKKLQINAESIINPYQSVFRVAEEWSVMDNLSDGKVGLSIALPSDKPNAEDIELIAGRIEEIRKLWSGQALKRVNGVGENVELKIFPKPIQKELPIYVTANDEELYELAGTLGTNVLAFSFGEGIEELTRKIRLYRQRMEDAGFNNGKVAVVLPTYIGQSTEEVQHIIDGPLSDYLQSTNNLHEAVTDGLKAALSDPLVSRDSLTLLGTKETCRETLIELSDLGVDEVICMINFGLEQQELYEGLKRLGEIQAELKAGNLL